MAPLAHAFAEVMLPVAHQLMVRDDDNSTSSGSPEHLGKPDAVWEKEGRYNYEPSFAASVIFLVIYVIFTTANVFQYFWYRSWFWWPMVLAIIMELVGYAARSVSIKNLDNRSTFIIQTILILVAPAVMAASCYQAFGRIVLWVVPPNYQSIKHLWLPARRITPIFVGFDILSFFVQYVVMGAFMLRYPSQFRIANSDFYNRAAGGAILSSADTRDEEERGKNTVLAGLALQLFTFGFFCIASIRLTIVLRTRLRNIPLPHDTNWPVFLGVVNAASLIILIRSVYRFIEYVLGVHNTLSDHEVFFYCLDALLIFFVVAPFICTHPAQYLPYIKIRRKKPEFSPNAGKGLFRGLAKGRERNPVPLDNYGYGS